MSTVCKLSGTYIFARILKNNALLIILLKLSWTVSLLEILISLFRKFNHEMDCKIPDVLGFERRMQLISEELH